jgi:hypothetical protein
MALPSRAMMPLSRITLYEEAGMRNLTMTYLVVVAFTTLAAAQDFQAPRAFGHVSLGIGGIRGSDSSPLAQIAGGGERVLYKGFSSGPELSYIFAPGDLSDGFGLFSTNVAYRFFGLGTTGKAVPFVTGGYSAAFRNETGHLVNFGGGMDYWLTNHAGLRFEFRDHVWPDRYGETLHILTYRIGFVFGR